MEGQPVKASQMVRHLQALIDYFGDQDLVFSPDGYTFEYLMTLPTPPCAGRYLPDTEGFIRQNQFEQLKALGDIDGEEAVVNCFCINWFYSTLIIIPTYLKNQGGQNEIRSKSCIWNKRS